MRPPCVGLGDHDRAAAEPGQPVPLAGVVALEPVGLILADIEPALRDGILVGGPLIGAVQARVPAPHAGKKALEGGAITTAAFPVNQSTSRPEARSRAFQIQSLLVFL